jgi:sigma-B regulation protein RsbU (phosphoserine phosphatase)
MSEGTKVLELRIPSCASRLKVVRSVVGSTAQMYGFGETEVDSLVLAVNEACMNIIQHAYGKQSTGEIILEIFDQSDKLVFRLTDFAKKVDKACIKPRDLTEIRPGGLGVHLMQEVMDQVKYLDCDGDCGNIVELVKKIHHRKGA